MLGSPKAAFDRISVQGCLVMAVETIRRFTVGFMVIGKLAARTAVGIIGIAALGTYTVTVVTAESARGCPPVNRYTGSFPVTVAIGGDAG